METNEHITWIKKNNKKLKQATNIQTKYTKEQETIK